MLETRMLGKNPKSHIWFMIGELDFFWAGALKAHEEKSKSPLKCNGLNLCQILNVWMIIFKCKSSNSKFRSQNIEIQSQSQQILCKTPIEKFKCQMKKSKLKLIESIFQIPKIEFQKSLPNVTDIVVKFKITAKNITDSNLELADCANSNEYCTTSRRNNSLQ